LRAIRSSEIWRMGRDAFLELAHSHSQLARPEVPVPIVACRFGVVLRPSTTKLLAVRFKDFDRPARMRNLSRATVRHAHTLTPI
jgi:CRP-like cAMP-binding protein